MTGHVLCSRSDLAPGRLVRAMAGRMPVLVTLMGDRPVVFAARCPHQGADLGAGCVVDLVGADADGCLTTDPGRPVVRCPWHGFEYDLATGEPLVPSPERHRLRLRHLTVRVEDGRIIADT